MDRQRKAQGGRFKNHPSCAQTSAPQWIDVLRQRVRANEVMPEGNSAQK
ncbi:MAG: hypothetical protein JNJ88_13360 [Planctomycetes bacterium]|nr:hypothetical protein [Planctomycetota bacterium]